MIKASIFAGVAATGLLAASTTAVAQTTPTQSSPSQGATAAAAAPAGGSGVTQGATVYDPQGGTVGTVESVQGEFAVVATSKNKVRLPKTSFAQGEKGPVIAMTAAQLDQAAAQAAPQQTAGAATAQTVASGTRVNDTQGGQVGTVSAVDEQFATVELTTGGKVRLPLSAFGKGDNGAVRVAMTAQQLSAAAGAAAPAGGPSGSGAQ